MSEQPSEVGPYKTVPSISCPGFYTLQENRINIFGPAKLRECHDYMAFARKGFAFGQSSARSQEGRLRKWEAGEVVGEIGTRTVETDWESRAIKAERRVEILMKALEESQDLINESILALKEAHDEKV